MTPTGGGAAVRRLAIIGLCLVLAVSGCSFTGVNSLPLPGAVGRGPGAHIYHLEIANAGTLESNSPVLIDDVVVGSVGSMRFTNWHADVEISIKPDVVVPANAVASVGQTSLLGSMHVALDPPPGQAARGQLAPGSTIALADPSTYPSTEQTLAALSAVVTRGGLGQIGDIIHSFNGALAGRQDQVRDLITRLDTAVGTLDAQRDTLIASIHSLDRLANTFATQRDAITHALKAIPPALDVLIRERPRFTTALDKLRVLSDTATRLVDDSQHDLVENLTHLQPTLQALADIGPELDTALAYATTFPFGQNIIDRGVRGDYFNVFAVVDLTIPRLKRTLFLGTRWGQEGATLVPAPGDPWQLQYTYDPLTAPLAPPPAPAAPPTGSTPPADAAAGGGG
ncbi:MCE family protein [Mycolicibacterium sphagni]|uniref:Mammalian cell entry protein n=1 Tax=Mycolicibacterium sphagni TaxID=1786 RepID=A0A255DYG3_9MYCO|nr:MCE family protein [Mycolicibacterium sphagni]OYN82152.1 mammalian cell entry protein [Mycolicibacterium sphagni]